MQASPYCAQFISFILKSNYCLNRVSKIQFINRLSLLYTDNIKHEDDKTSMHNLKEINYPDSNRKPKH